MKARFTGAYQPPTIRSTRLGMECQPILRPRLLRVLDGSSRLVIIRAPVGFGKSVLIAQWVEHQQHHVTVAQLTADESLSTAELFWYAVCAAVNDAGLSLSDETTLSARARFEQAVRRWQGPVLLVLDSYERVPYEVDDPLAEMIRRLPDLKVVIGVRSLRGFEALDQRHLDTTVVDAADLAMTGSEVGELFTDLGLAVSGQRVATLRDQAAGWPALLRSIAITLKEATGTVEDRTLVGRAASTYFRQRVFPLLGELRELYALALPTLLTDDVAELCVGRARSEGLLRQLEMNGMLTCELIDGERVYEWPTLAKEILCEQFSRDAPDLHREMHHRFYNWYRDAGRINNAMHHAIRLRNLDLLDELLQLNWYSLTPTHPELVDAIQAFQPSELSNRPLLRLLREIAPQMVTGSRMLPVTAAAIEEGFTAVERAASLKEAVDLGVALLIALRRAGDLERACHLAADLQRRFSDEQDVSSAGIADRLPILFLQVGIVRQLAADRTKSDEALTLAYRLAVDSPCKNIAANAAGRLALNAALAGDVVHARTWFTRFADVDVQETWFSPLDRLGGQVAGLLLRLDGLPDETRHASWDSLVSDYSLDDELWGFALYALAQHALIRGDQVDALQRIIGYRDSHELWLRPGSFAAVLLQVAQADLLLSLGRGREARRVLGPGEHPMQQVSRARLELITGNLEAAELTAQAGIDRGDATRRAYLDLLLIKAAVHHQRRNGAAANLLADAVKAAGGLLHSFALAPHTMLETYADHVSQLRGIVESLRTQQVGDVFPEPIALTGREALLLQTMATGLAVSDLSRELYVSTNTVKTQLRGLYRKLGVTSRERALEKARQLGLLDPRAP